MEDSERASVPGFAVVVGLTETTPAELKQVKVRAGCGKTEVDAHARGAVDKVQSFAAGPLTVFEDSLNGRRSRLADRSERFLLER